MEMLEQTITTIEIAEMLETEHWKLLRKLEGDKKSKGIITILTDHDFVVSDFFIPSMYKDGSGKENKCYKVTKKGCEFLANKFIGEKGVVFTARYINRFHEMENKLSEIVKLEISTEQMEKLLDIMEKQQQFMVNQEKFNQMVIKKLESSKRIQAYQDESDRKIFVMNSMKGEIIKSIELVNNEERLRMIETFLLLTLKREEKD